MPIDLATTTTAALFAKSNAPILLTFGSYWGTLAALRCLGALKLTVHLADSDPNTVSSASRYFSRKNFHVAPCAFEFERYSKWLENFGRKNPGFILYPSSDDIAWTISENEEELAKTFKLYQPQGKTVQTLLNKEKLHNLCGDLGLGSCKAYFPKSWNEFYKLMDTIEYPVVAKPITQVGLSPKFKGKVYNNKSEMLEDYQDNQTPYVYDVGFLKKNPQFQFPMLQEFLPNASKEIFSLGGFVEPRANFFQTLGSQKILQRPIEMGIGLCFESVDVPKELNEYVQKICNQVGYFGVFEAEFVKHPITGLYVLLDFNPRYYGQMQFEVFRGLPLPLLAYHGANKNWQAMMSIKETFLKGNALQVQKYKCANSWVVKFMLIAQWISGKISKSQLKTWWGFLQPSEVFCELIHYEDDPGPVRRDMLTFVHQFLKHPRSSFKTFFG